MFSLRSISYLLSLLCLAQARRYDNFAVYRVVPGNQQDLLTLQLLEHAPDSYVFLNGVHQVGQAIDVLVAPAKKALFLLNGLNITLLEANAQSALEAEEVAAPFTRVSNTYDWTKYQTLESTYAWLQNLAQQYEGLVEVVSAGSSYEKRDILGIKISYGKVEGKRAVFLEAGMHAREWISPATSTYIAHEILTNTDENVRKIVENFDWYIFPHTNPDGYVYTHTTDRLWRKTRTPYGNCFGADPNRNWDFHWNEVGSSNNPCSDTYAGPAAFSEQETRSLAKYLQTIKNDLFLYVSYHAFSQLLLFPYGYTKKHADNHDALARVFNVATMKLSERYGTRYRGGNIYEAIYPASGSTVDYAYGALNINYSYCYELRPSSRQYWTGFKLPANQIIPTGQETFDSLLAMANEAATLNK